MALDALLPEVQPFHKWALVATVLTFPDAQSDSLLPFAMVPDEEYDTHYEAIVTAIKGVVQEGYVVELPSVPHQFLREAPLVDGEWIDSYIVELAEWGARLADKGFLIEEPYDNHPMAWHRVIDPKDAAEAGAAVTMAPDQEALGWIPRPH